MEIRVGAEARQLRDEQTKKPPTLLGLLIRFLPVWALIIMILVIEPTLPIQAVRTAADWVSNLRSATPEPGPPGEPVFIVEGAESIELNSELPPPNWDLTISEIFRPEVQFWKDSIANWSVIYRIKPNMIATIMQIESCGNPAALSDAGAMGLMQVVQIHFEEGEDPFDPDTNVRRGLLYLGDQIAAANGDSSLAFAAYNGGPNMVFASPADWPQETQDYQFWASGIYDEAERGVTQSPTLNEWLDAGGWSLCAEAAENLGLAEQQ